MKEQEQRPVDYILMLSTRAPGLNTDPITFSLLRIMIQQPQLPSLTTNQLRLLCYYYTTPALISAQSDIEIRIRMYESIQETWNTLKGNLPLDTKKKYHVNEVPVFKQEDAPFIPSSCESKIVGRLVKERRKLTTTSTTKDRPSEGTKPKKIASKRKPKRSVIANPIKEGEQIDIDQIKQTIGHAPKQPFHPVLESTKTQNSELDAENSFPTKEECQEIVTAVKKEVEKKEVLWKRFTLKEIFAIFHQYSVMEMSGFELMPEFTLRVNDKRMSFSVNYNYNNEGQNESICISCSSIPYTESSINQDSEIVVSPSTIAPKIARLFNNNLKVVDFFKHVVAKTLGHNVVVNGLRIDRNQLSFFIISFNQTNK